MKAKPNWLQRIIGRTGLRAMKYAGIPLRDPALVALFGRQDSYAGMDVDEDTAMNFSAVWSAVSLIAATRAMLPLRVYKLDSKTPDATDREHIVDQLLNVTPNECMTPYTCAEAIQASALTWGNGYGWIDRDTTGQPITIYPIPSGQVKPKFTEQGEYYYEYRNAKAEPEHIAATDMIHIMGLSQTGYEGIGVITRARQSVGLGLAAEKYGATFFGNGATPRIVIEHPGELSPRAKQNIRQGWIAQYSNAENPHAAAILDEGMKFQTIGLPPEDSQFLVTRQFQVIEICRWFRVPPHMLYDLTQATNGNNEQQNLNFLTFTMQPWLVRWRQECQRKLFTLADHRTRYMDFDTSLLLATDTAARYAAYNTGRNGGWLTLNDIMRAERRPLMPPEIGDTHLAPSTMRVLEARDPSQPIDIETMNGLNAMMQNLATRTDIDNQGATLIINAVIPSATPELTATLVKQFQKLGIVK